MRTRVLPREHLRHGVDDLLLAREAGEALADHAPAVDEDLELARAADGQRRVDLELFLQRRCRTGSLGQVASRRAVLDLDHPRALVEVKLVENLIRPPRSRRLDPARHPALSRRRHPRAGRDVAPARRGGLARARVRNRRRADLRDLAAPLLRAHPARERRRYARAGPFARVARPARARARGVRDPVGVLDGERARPRRTDDRQARAQAAGGARGRVADRVHRERAPQRRPGGGLPPRRLRGRAASRC